MVLRLPKPEEIEDWLPLGYEERLLNTKRRLLINVADIRTCGCGGYVIYCGWNSTIEGVSAGVPMITWPLSSEQFFIENFMTDVIKVGGISIGDEEWVSWHAEPLVTAKREKVTMASWGKRQRRAVEEDGSSYVNVESFIEELRSFLQRESGNCRRSDQE
ncbi:abscisate beta-glucosyltransferase [Quercus suber]|uniref:Abscisate beta-glucosyltransferase n=1 Tax=Quercus suber TaxID=58331 RepID=A0AAW0KDZ9_QUESU